jgi:hypothetical protein
MKSRYLLLLFATLLSLSSIGQVENKGFKYQAVARDGSGYPIIDQEVTFQIKIYTINGNNNENYIENHYALTNQFGLVNLNIGSGEVVEGTFSNIEWGVGSQFIEISIDASGGNDFTFLGSSELLAVPMANYAAVAGNVVDTSVTNELQKLFLDHTHTLYLAPEGDEVDLSDYYNLDEIEALQDKIQNDSLYFENIIQNEVDRATAAEADLANLIDINANNILQDSLYFQDLIDNLSAGGNDDSLYFQMLIDQNTQKIISDSAFLKSLIDANNLAIQEEVTRAILAEALNAANIAANTNLINQLQTDLMNDSAFLKGLIDDNADAIATETTRAIAAELVNSNNIAQNSNDIAENALDILNDSTYFAGLIEVVDFQLQQEITRATLRDANMSDSLEYIYLKQISDSLHFQNQIDGLAGGGLDPTLENGKIFVGNDANVATGVFMSGDGQMTNSGVMIINPNAITTAKIANGNVTNSKLASSSISFSDDNGNNANVNLGEGISFSALGSADVSFDAANKEFSISATDNQTLTVAGNNLSISSGNSVDLSSVVGQEGPQGPAGPAGPQGPAGANGADGADGLDGLDGLTITSTVDNGDGTFTINYSDGTSFTSGDLTGPQGPQGIQGPQGVQGIQGPAGADGADGADGLDGLTITSTVDNGDGTFTINYSDGTSFTSGDLTGPQGPQGIQGPQGAQGIQGPAGADGANGADGLDGLTITSTVDNGDGTFTINYSDGTSFTSNDLTGPQGPQGNQGPIGPQGNQGPAGADGDDGVGVASTVNNGDGTFTINYTNGSSFTSVDLTGPQGPQGPVGPQGAVGPDGNDGVGVLSTVDNGDGSFTINYTDGSSFTSGDLTGPQGVQGADGADGADGISINWLGTLFPAPANPSVNDAYRDPVLSAALIWDGSTWRTMVEDGIQGPQGPTGPAGPAGTSLRDCPATGDWSAINEEFCIEVNENTADTWWDAVKYCGDQDSHVCSWQEWYYTCQKSGSGTINMTNDWEWTSGGISGAPNTATVVGNSSCTSSNTDAMTNSNTFRCCFTR